MTDESEPVNVPPPVAALVAVRACRLGHIQVRPHPADGGLTPEAAHPRSADDRLRNPDQLRRAPATIEAPEPL